MSLADWMPLLFQNEWWLHPDAQGRFAALGGFDALDEAAGDKVRPADMPLVDRCHAVVYLWGKLRSLLKPAALYNLPLVFCLHELNVAELPGSACEFELDGADRQAVLSWLVKARARLSHLPLLLAERVDAAYLAVRQGFDELVPRFVAEVAELAHEPGDGFARLVLDGLTPAQALVALRALDAPLPA